MSVRLARVAPLMAGLWGGVLLSIGLIGAPAGFAVTTRDVAGRLAGRMFAQEAYLSLVMVAVLFFLVRGRSTTGDGRVPKVSFDVLTILLALFCTIAGYFALLPMLTASRAGLGPLSFGTLHALSAGFYAVKTLAVVGLAWRLSATTSHPSSPHVLSREPSF